MGHVGCVPIPGHNYPDNNGGDIDIGPDLRYEVYDIGDIMSRYRDTPDIGTNIGVIITQYRDASDMPRYWVKRKIRYRDI